MLDHIRSENDEYYNLNRYDVTIQNDNLNIYYKDEQKCIEDKIIFSLKNTNFLKWLQDKNELPYHPPKISKDKYHLIKKESMEKEFGEFEAGMCPISFCQTILNNDKNKNWDCGHIISEFNQGATEPYNLRPICKNCNSSMGSKTGMFMILLPRTNLNSTIIFLN